MAADETSICNLALGFLGQSAVMSVDDASPAARYCKRFYAQTRDEVLQTHPWNFAIRRIQLARLPGGLGEAWESAFQLPVDCLRVLDLNGASDGKGFEIESGKLLADGERAEIRYIARVTDANAFTPLFVEALALKLAARLAVPLTGSRTASGELQAQYERVASGKARRLDAGEGRPKRRAPWMDSDLVRARAGGC